MYRKDFQGGAYFEVFTAQGKEPVAAWKLSGSSNIRKHFDKDVRSYVLQLDGSTTATKMQLPKDSKQTLGLLQKFIIFQIYVSKDKDFAVDLGITDEGRNKRRLILSTIYKEMSVNPLHCKISLGFITREKWLNLCLDLPSLVGQTWHGQTYKSTDSVCISASCRLRRIFTMKAQPPDTSMDEELYGFKGTNDREDVDGIPKQCQFACDVVQETQVVNVRKLWYYEGKGSMPLSSSGRPGSGQELDLNSSGSRKDPYHIAFGSKVAGTGQARKASSREGSAGSAGRPLSGAKGHARSKSDATDGPMPSSHGAQPSRGSKLSEFRRQSHSARERKNSDPGTNTEDPDVTVDKESLRTSHTWTDGADNKDDIPFVKPHPPKQPSSGRGHRRKPRVKSAGSTGKERAGSLSSAAGSREDISYAGSTASGSGSSQQHSHGRHVDHERHSVPQPTRMANEEEVERFLREMQDATRRESARSESESDPSSQNTTHETDDTILEVIQTLKHQHICNDEEDARSGDIEYSEEDDMEYSGKLYQFSSPPKSAQDRQGEPRVQRRVKRQPRSHGNSHGKKRQPRMDAFPPSNMSSKAQLDSDFILHDSSGDESKPRTRTWNVSQQEASSRASDSLVPGKGSVDIRTSPNGMSRQAPGEHSELQPTPGNSQSRVCISRGSLREIPKSELRLSGGGKPYNSSKYAMEDLSESYEAKMLQSLQRQAMEEGFSSEEDHGKGSKPTESYSKLHYDAWDGNSSDDASMSTMSTLKGPVAAGRAVHSYMEEMKANAISGEFLSQSNPRDWGNVFSPPIVLPGKRNSTNTSQLSPSSMNISPKELSGVDSRIRGASESQGPASVESDKEEELDLLYDPILNCYYDPHTCKYYELA